MQCNRFHYLFCHGREETHIHTRAPTFKWHNYYKTHIHHWRRLLFSPVIDPVFPNTPLQNAISNLPQALSAKHRHNRPAVSEVEVTEAEPSRTPEDSVCSVEGPTDTGTGTGEISGISSSK